MKINYAKLTVALVVLYAVTAALVFTAQLLLATFNYDIPSFLLQIITFIDRWNLAVLTAFILYSVISMMVGNLLLIKAMQRVNEQSKLDYLEFTKLINDDRRNKTSDPAND